MNTANFKHAFFASGLGVMANILAVQQIVRWFGDDTAKGVVGLYGLIVLYIPVLVIFTLPLLIVLKKFIQPDKLAVKLLYVIAASLGVGLGIVFGLQF